MALYLVTGGAGFIGSHLVQALLDRGHEVRVLDSFVEQVHGTERRNMAFIEGAEVMEGDVCHRDTVLEAVEGVDGIAHLAAAVGIGQSQYMVRHYTYNNTVGTATLWDVLAREEHGVRVFVQASTMSNYGEGAYLCDDCGIVYPGMRHYSRINREEAEKPDYWDLRCPVCGGPIQSVPTPEDAPLRPTSTYAASKRYQEELSLLMGSIYGIPTSALRLFNVLGPRQALGNPYTGVAAIFATALRKGKRARIYEDGMQSRDFVSVRDVASAFASALEKRVEGVFNIGTGERHTILELYRHIASYYGKSMEPEITYSFRKGDVRHIAADISRARDVLGYSPAEDFATALHAFLEWADGEPDRNYRDGDDKKIIVPTA